MILLNPLHYALSLQRSIAATQAFTDIDNMATNRISPSSSLVEALRALALERTQDSKRSAQAAQPDPGDKQQPVAAKHDVQMLRRRLYDLATEADLADTQSMMQARNHAVREILLWEFGSEFRTDSQFLPMVDAIGKTLDTDSGLQQRFIDLMIDLRKL